jgi:hypothetical protein
VSGVIARILRAALVGAATVFASKLPGQHWSTPPTAIVVAPDRGGAAGGEGDHDDGIDGGIDGGIDDGPASAHR